MKHRRPSTKRSHIGGGVAGAFFLAGLALGSSGISESLAQATSSAIQMTDEIKEFCANIVDAARDRRYAVQARELEELRADIDKRVAQLEAKRAEYEHWLQKRKDVIERAEDSVVGIYARMRPDAAAQRLEKMDAALAAAILMKLNQRQAGVIMNEMAVTTAARLTGIIADVAQAEDPS